MGKSFGLASRRVREVRGSCLERIGSISRILDDPSRGEDDVSKRRRIKDLLLVRNYSKFVDYYFGSAVGSECLATCSVSGFQVESFERLVVGDLGDLVKRPGAGSNRTCFQFRIWYRGAAKSVHATIFIPIWLYLTGRCRFFLVVGVNNERAVRLLADVRRQLDCNIRLMSDFGNYRSLLRRGSNRGSDFTTFDGAFFTCVGIDQPIRGARNMADRLDYIVIDDIEGKDNKKGDLLVPQTVDRIKQDYMGAYGNNGDRLMVICNNLFRHDGVIAKLLADFEGKQFADVSRVNLLDERGNYTWVGGHAKDYAKQKEREMGRIGFLREYMNEPLVEGCLFSAKGLRFGNFVLDPKKDILIGFWDLSYKDQGDFKAFVLMSLVREVKDGVSLERYYISNLFCRQCSLRDAMDYSFLLTRDLVERGFECLIYYDSSVNQESVHGLNIETLYDDYKYGIIPKPYRQVGNKYSRIESALRSPWEARKFCFDRRLESSNDFKDGFNQMLGFDKGSRMHDDFPDALASCTQILLARYRNMWNKEVHGFKPKFEFNSNMN